jgi:hypothetical protein
MYSLPDEDKKLLNAMSMFTWEKWAKPECFSVLKLLSHKGKK